MKNNKKNLLVTGCNGFIGQNFLRELDLKKYRVLNLDCLSYSSDTKAHFNFNEINFIKLNLVNYFKLKEVFNFFKPDIVVNFAAHSHVDKSISNSELFLENVVGTHNLLKCSLSVLKKKKIKYLQISTDEVFGSIKKGSFQSYSPYNPSSPYSASKASSDHFVSAFYKTYNLPITILYSCNNFGPFQNPEKLIPLTIWNLMNKKKIGIYGSGKQIRQWIYVKDNVNAILKLLDINFNGKAYCLGSHYEINNLNLVKKIIAIFHRIKKIKEFNIHNHFDFIEDRKGHDFRYFLDSKKLKEKIYWKQEFNMDVGLELTIKWYLKNRPWVKSQFSRI
jgi:dTDP-glucose 4,6-dehydratase